MKHKLIALWNLLTCKYYIVFTTKSEFAKWSTLQACLHPENHHPIVQIINDSFTEEQKTTTGTTNSITIIK